MTTSGCGSLLPIVVFLAAYTPGAVNFVVGQAGFTVFVVVLFNILVPEGWRTGLVRVQDIAIGAGISVAVGALAVASRCAWCCSPLVRRAPARRQPRTSPSALDVDVARPCTGDPDAAAVAVREDARARAAAALEDLALEHGGGHVDREGWGSSSSRRSCASSPPNGIVRAPAGYGAIDRLRRCGRHGRGTKATPSPTAIDHEADASRWPPASGRSQPPDARAHPPSPSAHPLSREPLPRRSARRPRTGVGARVAHTRSPTTRADARESHAQRCAEGQIRLRSVIGRLSR